MIVIVTQRLNGHEFKIGQEVRIIEERDYAYKCQSSTAEWWLTEEEFTRGNEELVPSDWWAGGIADNH